MAIKKKFPYRAALVACNGGCRAAGSEDGGCKDGCIGCGACIEKCKFGAISMNEYGVAEVDEEKCIACGLCQTYSGVFDYNDDGIVIFTDSKEKIKTVADDPNILMAVKNCPTKALTLP